MKARKLGYWITTALVALVFASGGFFDLAKAPPVAATMAHLGYPAYVATILGLWKLLGTVALLAPGFPRLKEWAYAGMVFDLTGAAVSHAAAGDGAAVVATPLVVLALAIASWALRPAGRRLAAVWATGSGAPVLAVGKVAA